MTGPVSNSPSIDPASRGDLAGVVRLVLTKFLQGVDDMLPAKVIAYDRTTNQARVQPLIAMLTTGNEIIQRGQIAEIQVLQLGGGGFVLSFPINPDDLGWIKASDRDISLFKQSLAAAVPNTQRLHSFEDAVFIPDSMMRGVTINSEDAGNVVLQTLDGTQRVVIWPDKVKVTGTNVEVVASAQAKITAPEVIVTAATKITLDSPLTEITGALSATGTGGGTDATFNGKITATGEIKTNLAGGVQLSTHHHTGVQTGGGNTGGPVG